MRRHLAALTASTLLLLLATAAHAQHSWTIDPGNPEIPSAIGGGYALAPAVIYDATTGVYRMWFTAHEVGGAWGIDLALSSDGVHWFAYTKNPVLGPGALPFEDGGVVYAGVVRDGTQYRMYYTGLSGCCTTAMGLATSPDGLTWTRYAGNPVLTPTAGSWDAGGIGASTAVCFDGATYFLLYQGLGASAARVMAGLESSSTTLAAGVTQQIGLATSTDGVTFTKSAANPVIPHGGSGSWNEAGVFPGGLFKYEGVLYAFFSGAPTSLVKESLGFATSTNDGATWVPDASNPVFGGGGAWDWNIGSGTAVLRNAALQLFYAGNTASGSNWSIGDATAPFDQPTATLATLVSAAADGDGVRLVWETGVEHVTVFRRREGAAWTALATRATTAGRLSFDDAGVQPGVRYAYLLGRGTDAADALLPEMWIEVPARTSFELFSARPNPTPGTITASFALPARGRTNLELFDLAGRRVFGRDFELGAGSHQLPLAPAVVMPGVYQLRVTFAGRALESRVVVAR